MHAQDMPLPRFIVHWNSIDLPDWLHLAVVQHPHEKRVEQSIWATSSQLTHSTGTATHAGVLIVAMHWSF